jgi:probable rRNA maturation factor
VLSVEVDILAETALPADGDIDSLSPLVEWVLREERQTGYWSIAIVLTNDDALRSLHKRFMGIDSETDVMTFPAGGPVGTGGGDIVISIDRAAEQASDWELSTWEEIRFLAVHGTLHLCGWADKSNEQRDAMLDRQRMLIYSFDRRHAEESRGD